MTRVMLVYISYHIRELRFHGGHIQSLSTSNMCKKRSMYDQLRRKKRLRDNIIINSFLAYVPTLYVMKNQENQWFSGVFRGYEMEIPARNRLT